MDEYLGDIKIFAGNYCPEGYMYCDGQTLQVQQNPALYSLLNNQYGGNGAQTFCLPNLNKTPLIQGTSLKYIICVNGIYPPRP
jgi:microcystin-dependent protein